MAHICPVWVGYLLLNPLRRLLENPNKMFSGLVAEGMTVLEPGCGMGFFTLALARMVGPEGRVVALDVQQKMLAVLDRRVRKAGLSDRVELRRIAAPGLGVADLAGAVDFAAAIHVVHEIPDQKIFFVDVKHALKPGGNLLVVEPKGHVSPETFERTVTVAQKIGFNPVAPPGNRKDRSILLTRPRD